MPLQETSTAESPRAELAASAKKWGEKRADPLLESLKDSDITSFIREGFRRGEYREAHGKGSVVLLLGHCPWLALTDFRPSGKDRSGRELPDQMDGARERSRGSWCLRARHSAAGGAPVPFRQMALSGFPSASRSSPWRLPPQRPL